MSNDKLLWFRVLVAVTLAVLIAGCGGGEEESTGSGASDAAYTTSASQDAAAGGASPSAPTGGAGLAGAQKSAGLQRKIIYTAEVSLVVDKLSPAQQRLSALVRQYDGYIAQSNIGGQSGSPRTATWKIRVPVTGYQNFLDAVTKIGEVQTVSSNSSDVSEEYYDIEARLRNKRVEEKRLLEHLNRSTAKLSDILQVEREISRVRGEIEQMTGRLRVLADLTSLTTISITIQEIKNYVPPTPPTFGTEITRTFQGSLSELASFGKGLLLAIVGLLPWLVVLLVVGLPLWKWSKRRYPAQRKPVNQNDEPTAD
jgi:hypothetical protein